MNTLNRKNNISSNDSKNQLISKALMLKNRVLLNSFKSTERLIKKIKDYRNSSNTETGRITYLLTLLQKLSDYETFYKSEQYHILVKGTVYERIDMYSFLKRKHNIEL